MIQGSMKKTFGGDFAVPRILIFADAGTEHTSFTVTQKCHISIGIMVISDHILGDLFFDLSDFFKAWIFIFVDWMSTVKNMKITCPLKYPVLQYQINF